MPRDELAREHAATAELRNGPRHADAPVVREERGEPVLHDALALEVGLLGEARADLGRDRVVVEVRQQRAQAGEERGEEVGVERQDRLDAGPLDLHRDVAPVGGSRPVHLRDARGGDRLGIEGGEAAIDRRAELRLDDRLDLRPLRRRDRVLQARELGGPDRRQEIEPRESIWPSFSTPPP
jgi:hypothetical protein